MPLGPGRQLIDENGAPYGLKHVDNKLRVSDIPYLYDIAEGNVPNHESVSKFGHNADVGASVEEVWDGSASYVFMSAASTLYLSSDNAGDDQDYIVYGLDANWDAQSATVTANGKSFVAIEGTWIRVFRVINQGTTDNAGNIYVSDSNTDAGGDGIPDTATAIKAKILAGLNQTMMAIWSVPDDYTAYLVSYYASTNSSKATDVYLMVRPFGGVFQVKKLITVYAGAQQIRYDFPLSIAAKSDVVIRAAATGGGGKVSAGFDIWYEK